MTALALAFALSQQWPVPQLAVPDALHPRVASPGATELGDFLATHSLTIDDAVTIALATNRNYATSIANLERAVGRTGQARAARNPQGGLNANVSQYDKPVTAAFGGGAPLTLTNQFNPIYSASVSLPIDIAGSIRAAVSQAEFSEVAARIDVNRTRNDAVFSVRNAFYQALRAKGQLVVAEDNLANAQTRRQDAEATLRAGVGTQFDVLTAQRDVADAEQSVVNARGLVTIALGQLKNAIGVDVSLPLKISDQGAVEEPAASATPPVVVVPSADSAIRLREASNEVELGKEYEASVAEAIAHRPEILESDAVISAARRGVAYARRSKLPSLAISANYVLQPNAAGFTPERQSSLGLSFSFPVFDGGLARAREKEAQAVVANAETDRRGWVDQVTLDVQQAYVSLVQARERVLVANVGLAQAREAFRLARLRAQVGVTASPQVSPQLELSNAQATLTQAETTRVNALYDYNIARSQLDRAVGRYSTTSGPRQG